MDWAGETIPIYDPGSGEAHPSQLFVAVLGDKGQGGSRSSDRRALEVAALRHRRFFSLAELNRAIGELLDKLNTRPFKKREGSRQSLFLELDRPALRPLPTERFDLSEWSQATVNIDYLIEFDKSFYSVPYQLARQTVEVRATPTTIEIFHQGKHIASHLRTPKAHVAVTNHEHRPASHRAHLDWPPSRVVQWAATIGPRTREVVERVLEAFPHPEMGYRSCLGIMLART